MDVTAAVLGFIQISFGFVERLLKAYDRMKDSRDVFQWYSDELKGVISIIEVLVREKSLRSDGIRAEIEKMHKLGERLSVDLEVVKKNAQASMRKSKLQFVKEVFKGTRDEKAMSTIIGQLSLAKTALCVHIQVSFVGVIKDVENNLVAKIDTIDEVNDTLVEILGQKGCLRIKTLLEDKPVRDDGTIVLTKEDVAYLKVLTGSESNKEASPLRERIITNNKASGSAFQINTPIGMIDLWEKRDRVVVDGNEAADRSVQVNYWNTTESLDYMRAWRAEEDAKKATTVTITPVQRADSAYESSDDGRA